MHDITVRMKLSTSLATIHACKVYADLSNTSFSKTQNKKYIMFICGKKNTFL